MLARVSHQPVRGLLGRGHASIGEDAALEDVGKIVIEKLTREVRTIIEYEIETGQVGSRVQLLDQGIVLVRSGVKAEGKDAPLVGCAHQLSPAPMQEVARRQSVAQALKVGF